MSDIVQGQVYWVDFGPAVGSSPAERYPFVVVQNDVFNRSAIATIDHLEPHPAKSAW